MVSVRHLPILGLLALVPVALYTAQIHPVVALSLVSVVIIGASLYLMFSPTADETAGESASAH
ncbi:MAG: hypothetical protein ABEJ78_01600 [Haloferacaceae archaeon]